MKDSEIYESEVNVMDDKMEKKTPPETISWYEHEEETTRMERHVKRWFIGWLITFIALIATNAGWLYYEKQFTDEVTVTQDVEASADGNSDINLNTVGGDYHGGESKSKADSN